ncbi:hypothetical protein F5050DRAFT_1868596 [Lentinula boryana]|uniref:Uncharacterized protein n=1 Tax=Lentinula boryana TaxID=40481 RepID=A0ABQ8PYA6_9AGAR|nr:hypothetical protein F5050DRAFT_1868596 [Lentinula boryana]
MTSASDTARSSTPATVSAHPGFPNSADLPIQLAAFTLQELPEVSLDWDRQLFTITRLDNEDLTVSTEEMIACILASLAMSRRWKMQQGTHTRYNEIARTLGSYIPGTSTVNFSFIHNGELWKSSQPVAYNCVFSGPQITELTESGAITGNIYNDVKLAYPKPARMTTSFDKDSGLLADFFAIHSTKSDQKVLLNGIFAAAKDAERNVAWRAKRNKNPKSLRGSQHYAETAPSLLSAPSTTASITEKMRMWRFRSGIRSTEDMDSASEAGPSH